MRTKFTNALGDIFFFRDMLVAQQFIQYLQGDQ